MEWAFLGQLVTNPQPVRYGQKTLGKNPQI